MNLQHKIQLALSQIAMPPLTPSDQMKSVTSEEVISTYRR